MAGAKAEGGGNAEKDTELVKHKEYFVFRDSSGRQRTDRGNIEYPISNKECRMMKDGGQKLGMSNPGTRANRNYVNHFVVFRCGIRKARTRITYKNISCD